LEDWIFFTNFAMYKRGERREERGGTGGRSPKLKVKK
jgi:hypothetical protein